jgi:serine/threonine-protein kinase SRPK3
MNNNTMSSEFLLSRRRISQKLASTDPTHPGYNHVRFSLDSFKVKGPRHGLDKHHEHLCIVYDVLREPIDSCMRQWSGSRFNGAKLRLLLPSLLKGLDYMHTCGVVHTDLKPDNIMMGLGDHANEVLDKFVQKLEHDPPKRTMPDHTGRVIYESRGDFDEVPTDEVIRSAKITDIGLAEWGDQQNNKPIQSNAFTAPEVILTAGWSYPADIWNLGVMLWDLIGQEGLFDCIPTEPGSYHSDKHLGVMIALMGPPPKELLERGSTSATYFNDDGEFRKPELTKHDITWDQNIRHNLKGEERDLFIDFAKKMITWLPEDRWTARKLLEHPFLQKTEFAKPDPNEELASSVSLIEKFAITKPRSNTITPADTPGESPNGGSPTMTPHRNHEIPTGMLEAPFRNLAMQGRASTHHFGTGSTLSVTSAPLQRSTSNISQKSNSACNFASQSVIDGILNKGRPKSGTSTPAIREDPEEASAAST